MRSRVRVAVKTELEVGAWEAKATISHKEKVLSTRLAIHVETDKAGH